MESGDSSHNQFGDINLDIMDQDLDDPDQNNADLKQNEFNDDDIELLDEQFRNQVEAVEESSPDGIGDVDLSVIQKMIN